MNPFRRSLIAVLVLGLAHGNAWAAPQGGQVVSGQATIARQGNLTTITSTPGAILQWQSFSVGAGEIARFNQQSASSSVLNRVVGQDPSQILGALQSNGRVFLINPNGILFGPGARVDVNGLVASTLALSNEDFLAGRLNFRAGDKAGAVVNQGTISTPAGGRVYLVAPSVENSGVITTPQGATLLAAGRQVSLVDSASPYVDVIVSAPADRALNVGEVVAAGGSIGIYGALINQRGRLDADSMVVGENGRIVLKASGDTLLEAGSRTTARGAGKGGEIQVLGERVALTGDAKVDASGKLGGGTVLVGGDYQGKNPAIQNAKQTYIGAEAEIRVDALDSGDGGKAIAWSDGLTRVYGSISARGGEQSGNGGFIETSGKTLDMQGRVDTRAPHGATGTLLLDPTNIFIADSQIAATNAPLPMLGTDSSADSSGSPFAASGSVRDSLLTAATLMAALEVASVVVSTDNASGTGDGFIQVVNAVTWSAPNSLTLNAAGKVMSFSTISGASLIVNAGAGIDLRTQVRTFSASDTGNDTSIIVANTGNLTLGNVSQGAITSGGGVNITSSGLINVTGAITTNAGNIAVSSDAGVIVTGSVTSTSGTVTVSPPPSADLCRVAPSTPLCQVVSPPLVQAVNSTVNLINTTTNNVSKVTTPLVPPAPPTLDLNGAAAAQNAADRAAQAAAAAFAAAQAAAKAAADVAANSAAYEAAQVAQATQTAAAISTDPGVLAKAAADAAAKAAADTAAMKAAADAAAKAAADEAAAKAADAEKAKAKAEEAKKEEKKDEKNAVASTDKSGAKNDAAAKKMYCN